MEFICPNTLGHAARRVLMLWDGLNICPTLKFTRAIDLRSFIFFFVIS